MAIHCKCITKKVFNGYQCVSYEVNLNSTLNITFRLYYFHILHLEAFYYTISALIYGTNHFLESHGFVHFIPAGFSLFHMGQGAAQDCI